MSAVNAGYGLTFDYMFVHLTENDVLANDK